MDAFNKKCLSHPVCNSLYSILTTAIFEHSVCTFFQCKNDWALIGTSTNTTVLNSIHQSLYINVFPCDKRHQWSCLPEAKECVFACVRDRDEYAHCFMCCLIVGKTALPQRYHPANCGDKAEAYQTGCMKLACQTAPNRTTFDCRSGFVLWQSWDISRAPRSITLEALMWNHLVGCLTSVSGTPLEHQTRRSQTAITLAQSVRGGGKKVHRTGLPTAVSLTEAEICGN